MKPEIESYLREHGERYTREALREQLLKAGHDPADVDAAFAEWSASQASGLDAVRVRFSQLNWLIHGAALAIVVVWLIAVGNAGFVVIVALVLGVALIIGAAISWAIGRLLLPGPGLAAAVAVSAVSALLIGGSCLAMTGGFGQL